MSDATFSLRSILRLKRLILFFVPLILASTLLACQGAKTSSTPVPGESSSPVSGKVREFILEAVEVKYKLATGKITTVWAFNGKVPGPEIRVKEGDTVRVVFTNKLPAATTIHWHGVNVPWTMDGVPGVSQKPVMPGETFTYQFVASPAGTRFYHTHGSGQRDEGSQLDMGLSGPLIIEPATPGPAYDIERVLMLDEWNSKSMPEDTDGEMSMDYDTFTINGKAWPDTQPLHVKAGQRVLLRLINAGTSSFHPMHLHGHSFRIVAMDGNPLPPDQQMLRDTLTLGPGERYDIEFTANNPGVWVFHCHELHHADDGMIMLVQYEGYQPVPLGTAVPKGHAGH